MKTRTFFLYLFMVLVPLNTANAKAEQGLLKENRDVSKPLLTPKANADALAKQALETVKKPEIQLIQKTFEKLSDIDPKFFTEKKETVQKSIKESSFFKKNPNLQSAALHYTDAFYLATQVMKYQVDAGAKLFIPCVLMGLHLATGDIPLAVSSATSLARQTLQLLPAGLENWKNTGKMVVSGLKTVKSLTKSVLSVFKR